MTTATVIEVKTAEPPKDGKKQGVVRTTSGDVLGVWPDKLGLLRPGSTYRVEVTEREYNGRTFKTITKVTPQENAGKQDNTAHAAHPQDREFEFVTRLLPAMLSSCMIGRDQSSITEAARMLRSVYRDSFTTK